MKERAYRLMKQWCDTLLSYQIKTHTPYTNNSLICPACHVIHGRIADLCFPLTVLWSKTGKEDYLKKADELIDWSEYNLMTEDGIWYNDAGSRWLATSAFSALGIGESLYHFDDILPEKYKNKWMSIFRRMIDTIQHFDTREGLQLVSNYYCGTAAALAMAWRLTGDIRYYEMSKPWIEKVLLRFDENGLLFGEGYPMNANDGSSTVDMGYDLEESLPLLLRYADLTGEHKAFLRDRLHDHLAFLLPDGAIDNSFGSRHNKWTYWGSRTSDGLIEGLALVLDDPMFADACERVLTLYENCTHDGLLSMPMANEANEPTCLHHTFTHAKALALLVVQDIVPLPQRSSLPCEVNQGVKKYQNGKLLLVTNGSMRATFSAVCARHLPDHTANGGGSMNLLYHPDYGIICAATSAEYVPTEPLNQQYLRHSDKTECMTAQFVIDGIMACKDQSVTLSAQQMTVTASTELWQASYTVNDNSVDILLVTENGLYHLPIVCAKQTTVTVSDDRCTVIIGQKLRIVSDVPLIIDATKRCFNQVGGLMYLPISAEVKGQVALSIQIL